MNANGIKVEVSTELETIVCCYEGCGLLFAVPATWRANRRADHTWWYCPNGHQQHYGGETKEEKRIRELEAQNRELALQRDNWRGDAEIERQARQQVQRSLAATKGVLTRTRNRVAAGVCPCCNRTFQNLGRHMKGQHPDFAGAE